MTQNSCFHKTHVSRCCINFPHEKTYQILTNLSKEWDVDRNQRVTMPYESLFHENLMKMCWKTHEPFFMAMKTAITDFHEIIFTSCFHQPWKVYKAMNMDFHGSWKSHILDRYISWPLKRQLQPSMYFMGDESSNGPWNSHEGTIKNPWKCPTHTSRKVDINALEKCCTHLLIRNISCQICLNLGQ